MQTLLSCINIVLPISLGDILSPSFSKAFNKLSNFAMCHFFDGVNNNKLSIIALQYFLLCKHSNIALI